MDETLREIREQPGFERFLTPPSEEQLLQAAADGPVVILNASSFRCDASIIDSRGFSAIELTRLSRVDIAEREKTLESRETLPWL